MDNNFLIGFRVVKPIKGEDLEFETTDHKLIFDAKGVEHGEIVASIKNGEFYIVRWCKPSSGLWSDTMHYDLIPTAYLSRLLLFKTYGDMEYFLKEIQFQVLIETIQPFCNEVEALYEQKYNDDEA